MFVNGTQPQVAILASLDDRSPLIVEPSEQIAWGKDPLTGDTKMDFYIDIHTGAVCLVDLSRNQEWFTTYQLRGETVEVDATLIENFMENGFFPPSYFQDVEIADLPVEIQEQIDYDLEP